jgi:tripartite-type tricarboxylate transporter receptor subunit TctC
MIPRRKSLALAICCLLLPAGASARAQGQYPERPITLVNPLPAGGGVDIAMRGLAKELQTILGQPVLVESRAGAGGTIAGTYVAQAKPDGYVVGLLQSTQAIPEVYSAFQKPPYTNAQLRPVARFMNLIFGLPSRPDAPWSTMAEFVAYAKANPGKVRWGRTVGIGHPLQLLSYSLIKKQELKVIEVPFKGAADAITALLGGHIDVAFGVSVTATEGHMKAGRLKVLAIHNSSRLASLPDVPTFAEQGLDPGVMPIYNTFFVPKDTPDAIVAKLHDAVKQALQAPAMVEFAEKNGFVLYYGGPGEIAEELRRDREVTTALIDAMQKDQKEKPAQ